jgi:hypothetical protein
LQIWAKRRARSFIDPAIFALSARSRQSRRPIPRPSKAAESGVRSHHNSMRVGNTPSVPSLAMWRGTKERGTHDAQRKRKPIRLAIHRGTHWAGTSKTLPARRHAAGVARSIHRGASAGESDAPKRPACHAWPNSKVRCSAYVCCSRMGQRPQASSASRVTAGAFGFLTFTQCGERPCLTGAGRGRALKLQHKAKRYNHIVHIAAFGRLGKLPGSYPMV